MILNLAWLAICFSTLTVGVVCISQFESGSNPIGSGIGCICLMAFLMALPHYLRTWRKP